ncbi:MAG: COQ9 family protein [Acidocella sp.]|nr:COQ9 family protein [Acidocella sp.]
MPIEAPMVAILDAMLAAVPFDGWTVGALRQAMAGLGQDPADAPLMFPGGPGEMIEAFCTLADERMVARAEAADLSAYGLTGRVRSVLGIRFEQNRAHKAAIRRALAWLALPMQARRAARITAATVDAVWFAAGDKSADFSWYTKRGILAGVYASTLLFWVQDASDEDEETMRFLDRRLGDVGKIGKLRGRLQGGLRGGRRRKT